ncbi:hypothetical protein EK0264_09590 [Epidermidibacterium keratini]|uniref:Signal transduction histidine kinase subgroup 3 dimerisation and phosphoacceptor domain-containing protein n=1 Tax=Epidermidibacterium keratini TaxID=1891644 RepID=A0A7L4YNX4_9ACTN|nr:histidine kinase [Epidermidibacterium keratini]QHC00509.1 hypothetical protein EK0264_09590 [Epidermidibacterium keratini]
MQRWRWAQRSHLNRFELYTGISLYLLAAIYPMILARWNSGFAAQNQTLTTVFWVLVVAQVIVMIALIRDSIRAVHEQRGAAPMFIVAVAVVATAVLAVSFPMVAASAAEPQGAALWVPALVSGYAAGAIAAGVSTRLLLPVGAMALLVCVGIWLALGRNIQALVSNTIGVAVFIIAAMMSTASSIAMLRLMVQIDRARETEAKLAVAEERLRFGRDLHDTLGRNLSAIALKSQLAGQLATRDGDLAAREMTAVRQLAQESLGEMRAVVGGYRHIDLDAELRGAQSLLRAASIRCDLQLRAGDVPEAARDAVGWLVRESVTNVIRHSSATVCRIDGNHDKHGFTVTVTNDRPNAASKGGNGLRGLAERLAAVGGTVRTEHTDDRFTVTTEFAEQPASTP